jgi:hypothetical protein
VATNELGTRINMEEEKKSPQQIKARSMFADISGENVGPAINKQRIAHPKRRLVTAIAGIGVAATLLGIPKTSGVAARPVSTEGNQGISTPVLTIENPASLEVLQKQQEIEQKYGIDLMSEQDATAQALEKDAPVKVNNWTYDEISVLDGVLSSIPPSLYKPIDGIGLKIFIGNLSEQCTSCAGVEYGKSRIVGFQEYVISDSYKGGFLTLAVHEFTHGVDNVTGNSLWPKVNEILGDKSFLKLKEFKMTQGEPVGNSEETTLIAESFFKTGKIDPVLTQKIEDENMAVNALVSFISDKSFPEGIAKLSESYILGKRRFLLSYGPVLDGNGYDNSKITNNPPISELMQNYPKAEALYLLYKNSIFGGREYTSNSTLIPKN